jgi:hypothetical protein
MNREGLMFATYVKALPIIFPVTLISCVLVAINNGFRSRVGQTAAYGTVGGYLMGGLVFGLFAILVYQWMAVRWAAQAAQYYLWLAVGLAVLFSIMAFASRFFLKETPWVFWIGIHFLWALPYGWYLPRLLGK